MPAGGEGGVSLCRICAHIAVAFLQRNIFGGYRPERSTADGGAQSLETKYEWTAPNSLLVQTTSVSASQAKVVKAHAASKVCENLINTLKLLANQQKDGD